MPTVFSRNNSNIETDSTKSSNQRMHTSLYDDTSNETNSLTDNQLINSTILSITNNTNNNARRPHSVGPIPHAITIDSISEQSKSPLKSLNESDSLPINSTKKFESRKIDFHLSYILLYTQPYDSNRITFALNTIEILINLIPQQLIYKLLLTTNIQSSSINIHNHRLHELLLRHRYSIDGKNFYLTINNLINKQHQSYLYTLLNILLIYTRSYYPKTFDFRLNIHDIQENRKIHIKSLKLLKYICHNLSLICMENNHINIIIINYINNLFQKVSLQKIILHLFNTTINYKQRLIKNKTLTKIIYDYNIELLYHELIKQYLNELIQLLEEIILLEHILRYYQQRSDINSNRLRLTTNDYSNISLFEFNHHFDSDLITKNTTINSLRYVDNQPIVNQSLFLTSILQYLKHIDFIENHYRIINLVARILPHCSSSLKSISSLVIEQICRNLCFIVQIHHQKQQQQQGNRMKLKYVNFLVA